jgi:hypothetical protein
MCELEKETPPPPLLPPPPATVGIIYVVVCTWIRNPASNIFPFLGALLLKNTTVVKMYVDFGS